MNNRDIVSTTATTNHTTNYDLPLWESGDITSWQGNLNDAFNKIDTAMFENKTEMLGYKEIADKLEETNEGSMQVFDTLNQKVEDNAAKIAALETKTDDTNAQVTANSTAINQLRDEDETVKTQMDSMQDDIGKLMDMLTGRDATPETPLQFGGNSKLLLVGASSSASNIVWNVNLQITANDNKGVALSHDDSMRVWRMLFPTEDSEPKWVDPVWTKVKGGNTFSDIRIFTIGSGESFQLALTWTEPVSIIGQLFMNIYYRPRS